MTALFLLFFVSVVGAQAVPNEKKIQEKTEGQSQELSNSSVSEVATELDNETEEAEEKTLVVAEPVVPTFLQRHTIVYRYHNFLIKKGVTAGIEEWVYDEANSPGAAGFTYCVEKADESSEKSCDVMHNNSFDTPYDEFASLFRKIFLSRGKKGTVQVFGHSKSPKREEEFSVSTADIPAHTDIYPEEKFSRLRSNDQIGTLVNDKEKIQGLVLISDSDFQFSIVSGDEGAAPLYNAASRNLKSFLKKS